jgi:hypothetical protein
MEMFLVIPTPYLKILLEIKKCLSITSPQFLKKLKRSLDNVFSLAFIDWFTTNITNINYCGQLLVFYSQIAAFHLKYKLRFL